MVFVTGLPRVGKSTVARQICRSLKARHLNTDRIRRSLFKKRTYSQEESRQTYEKMYELMEHCVQRGQNAVLDGVFSDTKGRKRFYRGCQRLGVEYVVVYVTANESVLKKRLENLKENPKKSRDYSEADFEVYRKIKRQLIEHGDKYSVPFIDGVALVVVDNSQEPRIVGIRGFMPSLMN